MVHVLCQIYDRGIWERPTYIEHPRGYSVTRTFDVIRGVWIDGPRIFTLHINAWEITLLWTKQTIWTCSSETIECVLLLYYKKWNNHPSSVSLKSLDHGNYKTGNKCHTQDNSGKTQIWNMCGGICKFILLWPRTRRKSRVCQVIFSEVKSNDGCIYHTLTKEWVT